MPSCGASDCDTNANAGASVGTEHCARSRKWQGWRRASSPRRSRSRGPDQLSPATSPVTGSSQSSGNSIFAFTRALTLAEKRAGVRHNPYRRMHGFRRGVAGDVLELTGDVKLALDFIGDTDVRMARTYLKKRDERLAAVVAMLDRRTQESPQTVPKTKSEPNTFADDAIAQELVEAGAGGLEPPTSRLTAGRSAS